MLEVEIHSKQLFVEPFFARLCKPNVTRIKKDLGKSFVQKKLDKIVTTNHFQTLETNQSLSANREALIQEKAQSLPKNCASL